MSDKPKKIRKYVWLDCETTGLDPFPELILEVAAIVTNTELVEEGEWFHSLVWNGIAEGSCNPSHTCRLAGNDYVREMHTKNGLLAELAALPFTHEMRAPTPEAVDAALCSWLPENAEVEYVIAGSTIWFDKGFAQLHLPRFHARLNHRGRDVSDTKMALADALGWEFEKAEAHRAKADVIESLGVARVIQQRLRVLRDEMEDVYKVLSTEHVDEQGNHFWSRPVSGGAAAFVRRQREELIGMLVEERMQAAGIITEKPTS